jgi:hypothetical protein
MSQPPTLVAQPNWDRVSVILAAQLKCEILSWLETHVGLGLTSVDRTIWLETQIGLGLTSVEPRPGHQKY